MGRYRRASTIMADIDLRLRRTYVVGMLTAEQCRAARGLLAWTQEELADRAGLSRSTIRSFENGQHDLHRASAAVIRTAFEDAGVMLIDADELGPGVRLQSRTG